MNRLVNEVMRLLTPTEEATYPTLSQAHLDTLNTLIAPLPEPQELHQLLGAVAGALGDLQVARVRRLVKLFGHRLGLTAEWPLCIAPAVMASISRAYRDLGQPDRALALSRHFCCYRDVWPQLIADMQAKRQVQPAIQLVCPIAA